MALVPVFDPSEARYATLAANMARSGDFVVPHFTHQGVYQSFDGKPPLVFQAGGLFVKAFGTENKYALQFAVRLFPLLSAALLLYLVFLSVRSRADGDTARLAVAITATTSAFFAAAGISMTDMTLTLPVAGALLVYDLIERTQHPWLMRALVAALLAGGMLPKGPVAIALFGVGAFADAILHQRLKRLFDWRWLVVAPIFLVITVPWFVLVEQRNPGSVWYFFYNENFLRFVTHDYGDKYGAGREKFRGIAIIWALIATLPWVLLPLAGLKKFIAGGTWRRSWALLRGMDFALTAAAAITLFWCLTSRVLLYYLFPVMPLFAVYLALSEERELVKRFMKPVAALTAFVITGALIGGMCFSDKMQGDKTPNFQGYYNRYSYEFYHGPSK